MARVSVIMAAYNCGDTIQESVESILEQTYTNWELIACDDGSSDETREILMAYHHQYPDKITFIQNSENRGLPFSLNHCLKYAKGEYIARMDADDKSHKTRLEKQVAFLDEHPEVDVVGTAMSVFNGESSIGINYPPKCPGSKDLGLSVPFFHATIMMRKKVYDYLGGYSLKKSAVRCEDVELWFRFFGEGFHGANIQEPLYYVREDMQAVKRRRFKYAINASITLLHGYKQYDYPIKQYVYVCKPIVSACIPKFVKHMINQKRWHR